MPLYALSPGLVPGGPQAVEGGWWRRRRTALRRAFLAAAVNGVAGLAGARASAPKRATR